MLTFSATDKDLGENGTISYTYINTLSGTPMYLANGNVLSLNGVFPYFDGTKYGDRYTVRICDNGSPPKCSSLIVVYGKSLKIIFVNLYLHTMCFTFR